MTSTDVSIYAIPGIDKDPESIVENVIKEVFGLSLEQTKQKTRKREICFPRQVHMTMLQCAKFSLYDSGKPFSKDHATALHARKIIVGLIDTKYPIDDYNKVIAAFNKFRGLYPHADMSKLSRDWN